jgi:hypothetical protein
MRSRGTRRCSISSAAIQSAPGMACGKQDVQQRASQVSPPRSRRPCGSDPEPVEESAR